MCYDVSFKADVKELSDYFPDIVFDNQKKIDFGPVAHVQGHLYAEYPIVFRDQNLKRKLKPMHWACVPAYIKELSTFSRRNGYLNAKSEKIFETKSYWNKIRDNRCLIPVTAFYEHREVPNFTNKIPYHISLKDQPTFFVPGLYAKNYHLKSDDDAFYSWSMLTRIAENNWVMRQIHNAHSDENRFRMPLLLPFELSELWLSPDLSVQDYHMLLDYEMRAENLEYYTVWSIRSRKPRPDGKEKDELFDWGIPPLGDENLSTQGSLFPF